MFSWFLKLLGIDEDRPASSGNSYLDSNTTSDTTKNSASKAVETPKPAPKAEEAPTESATKTDVKPDAVAKKETKPEPEVKAEPKEKAPSTSQAKTKSLIDEFPDLKANYAKILEEAGFTTKASIDKADDKELIALKGIGQATVKMLRS